MNAPPARPLRAKPSLRKPSFDSPFRVLHDGPTHSKILSIIIAELLGDRRKALHHAKAEEMINHVPAFYGARHGAGHTATVDHPGGGEYANVASNWLLWQFKNDKKAGAMFAGKNCGLCTNANWDVQSKGIKG